MRMTLGGMEPQPPGWPEGISPAPFDPDRHARAARSLLNDAYAAGGGAVRPFTDWWAEITADPEFDQTLCLVAVNRETSGLVAFAHCWSTAFIKDIAVAEGYRRRGIGHALLSEIFLAFHRRGAGWVDLKVEADNASAIACYESMGMIIVHE